jgi:NAD(P)-dependent dehydrogenase (short-subunit alcohol dehydrogenase family)
MNNSMNGTVIITGPTGGLGKALALEMAKRPESSRPDLLLIGREGEKLADILKIVRDVGATAYEVPCDFSRLSDVRAAADAVKTILASGKVRPLHVLVANAGLVSMDTRTTSVDGYEMTFAVNYLAHAQLIGDLIDSFVAPARIVLVGSDTYYLNTFRRILHVPEAQWRDPIELAQPAAADVNPSAKVAGTAYADSKLAILYYAHELQRHVSKGVNIIVFEPGWMPGTGLGRGAGAAMESIGRALGRLPGMATPAKSAPAFASVVLDEKWSHLRDGAYVIINKETELMPFAHDTKRERRLWEATKELLERTQ